MGEKEMKLCECGCGEEVTKEGNKFLVGHWVRINQPMKNPKIIAKMAATIKKRWKDPEVRAMYLAIQNRAGIKAKKSIAMKRIYQEGYQNPMSGKSGYWFGKEIPEETKKKMSVAQKGKPKWSKEEKRKFSLMMKGKMAGEKNPMYGKTGRDHPRYGGHHTEDARRRISIAHKGKPKSEEHKRKMSEAQKIAQNRPEVKKKKASAMIGEKSCHWRGGRSFEPYSPEFNNVLKFRIRQRDNFTCQLRKETEEELGRALSIHHIDYDKKNNQENNLIALCCSCNGKVNFNREYWQTFFKEI